MAKGLIRSLGRANAGTEPAIRRVTYPVKNLILSTTSGVAAVGFGTAVMGKLPEGNILFLGAVSYLQFLTTDADVLTSWTGNYGIGTTATADNNIAAPATDSDIIASATISAATGKLSPVTRGISPATIAVPVLDNTANNKNLNLQLLIADASYTDSQAADFTVNGYLQMAYMIMGDN